MKKILRSLLLGFIPFVIIAIIFMPIIGIAHILRYALLFSYDLSIGLSTLFVCWIAISVILYLSYRD